MERSELYTCDICGIEGPHGVSGHLCDYGDLVSVVVETKVEKKILTQQNQELRERLALITDAANRVQENREHMGSILFAGLLNILRSNAESAAELLGEGNDG